MLYNVCVRVIYTLTRAESQLFLMKVTIALVCVDIDVTCPSLLMACPGSVASLTNLWIALDESAPTVDGFTVAVDHFPLHRPHLIAVVPRQLLQGLYTTAGIQWNPV